jgi:hypothetical protein
MANWDEDQVDEGGDEDTFEDMPYDDDEHIDWDNNDEPEGAD